MNARNINNENFVDVLPRILDPNMKFTKESLKPDLLEIPKSNINETTMKEVKKISFFNEYKYVIIMIIITILAVCIIYFIYKYYNDKKEITKNNETKEQEDKSLSKEERNKYLSEFIVNDDDNNSSESSKNNTVLPPEDIGVKPDESGDSSLRQVLPVVNPDELRSRSESSGSSPQQVILSKEDNLRQTSLTSVEQVQPLERGVEADIRLASKSKLAGLETFDQLSTENIEVLLSKYNDGNAKRNDIISIDEYNKEHDVVKIPELCSRSESSDSSFQRVILTLDEKVNDSNNIIKKELNNTENLDNDKLETEEENYDSLHNNNSDDEIDYFKRFTKK